MPSDEYQPTGIDLVLGSVQNLVALVDESIRLDLPRVERGVPTQPLRAALFDLRASYFAFLHEQQEASEHG